MLVRDWPKKKGGEEWGIESRKRLITQISSQRGSSVLNLHNRNCLFPSDSSLRLSGFQSVGEPARFPDLPPLSHLTVLFMELLGWAACPRGPGPRKPCVLCDTFFLGWAIFKTSQQLLLANRTRERTTQKTLGKKSLHLASLLPAGLSPGPGDFGHHSS